VEVDA